MAKYCTHCGNEVSDKALFCKYCGNELDVGIIDNEKTEPIINRRYDESKPIKYAENSDKKEEKEDSFPRYMKIVILVSIALIIAVIGIGMFLYFGGTGENAGKNNTEDTIEKDNQDEVDGGTEAEIQKDHRYEVINVSMTWKEAKEACEEAGGHLATITSADEYYTIVELIENDGVRKYHYWLGATDEASEDEGWKWITGEKVDDGFNRWDAGKPNNSHDTDKKHGEDYMEMKTTQSEEHPDSYMKWNDVCNTGVAVGYEEDPYYYSQKYYGYICEWDN